MRSCRVVVVATTLFVIAGCRAGAGARRTRPPQPELPPRLSSSTCPALPDAAGWREVPAGPVTLSLPASAAAEAVISEGAPSDEVFSLPAGRWSFTVLQGTPAELVWRGGWEGAADIANCLDHTSEPALRIVSLIRERPGTARRVLMTHWSVRDSTGVRQDVVVLAGTTERAGEAVLLRALHDARLRRP